MKLISVWIRANYRTWTPGVWIMKLCLCVLFGARYKIYRYIFAYLRWLDIPCRYLNNITKVYLFYVTNDPFDSVLDIFSVSISVFIKHRK